MRKNNSIPILVLAFLTFATISRTADTQRKREPWLSCQCLAQGSWCGSRSVNGQLAGTCQWDTVFHCRNNTGFPDEAVSCDSVRQGRKHCRQLEETEDQCHQWYTDAFQLWVRVLIIVVFVFLFVCMWACWVTWGWVTTEGEGESGLWHFEVVWLVEWMDLRYWLILPARWAELSSRSFKAVHGVYLPRNLVALGLSRKMEKKPQCMTKREIEFEDNCRYHFDLLNIELLQPIPHVGELPVYENCKPSSAFALSLLNSYLSLRRPLCGCLRTISSQPRNTPPSSQSFLLKIMRSMV